jgi:hypothetical protein
VGRRKEITLRCQWNTGQKNNKENQQELLLWDQWRWSISIQTNQVEQLTLSEMTAVTWTSTDIKGVRKYYRQHHTHKFNDWDDINHFSKRQTWSKLSQEKLKTIWVTKQSRIVLSRKV